MIYILIFQDHTNLQSYYYNKNKSEMYINGILKTYFPKPKEVTGPKSGRLPTAGAPEVTHGGHPDVILISVH